MRQSEFNYRQNDYSPRFRTNQSSLNDETEKRIVMLYNSGQSIESITREVGRARHRVVHILQSKGVFGDSPKECEVPRRESAAVENPHEEHSAKESRPQIAVEKPIRKQAGRSKSPRKATDKPTRIPETIEESHTRWSPPVVDALCKVAMESNLYPGKTVDEVRKILSC